MDFSKFQKEHINPADLGIMNPNEGDPDFDLEHNKRVIAKTIEHAKRMHRQRNREYMEAVGERSFAAAKFLENVKSGVGEQNVEKYFGKQYLDHLKGQQIAEKYKMAWTDAKKKEEALRAFKKTKV